MQSLRKTELCVLLLAAFLIFLSWQAVAEASPKDEEMSVEEALSGFDNGGETDSEKGQPGSKSSSQGSEMSVEDALGGFEDEGGASEPEAEEPGKQKSWEPSRWELQGDFTLATALNINHDSPQEEATDHRGLSRMRPEIYLQLDADIYESWRCRVSGWGFYNLAYNIHDNRDYTHEFLEAYEDELEFRETYIEGTLLPSLDLKIGRQIVVWGNTENFRVTDVLNPLDNRTPGLVDIEDLRWPVCMAKMDYYWGNCSLTAIAIPELFFGESPVYGSDFFPYTGEMQPASQEMPPAAGASAPFNYSLPEENKPAQNLENTELALAFQGIFSGWDFSLYAAHYYNDMVHPEQVDQIQAVNPNTGEPVNIPVYELEHAELNMFGAELNVISGNYMFKAEAAYKDGYEFANVDDEKSRLDTLVGVEYSGFSDIMLFFEVVYSCFFDFDEEADAATTVAEENEYGDFGSQARQAAGYVEEDWFEVALRYTQNFMRERLELTCLTMWHDVDGRDAMVERLSLAYDVTDTVTATVGGIFYQGGDQPGLGWIHKNNRLYLNLKYSF